MKRTLQLSILSVLCALQLHSQQISNNFGRIQGVCRDSTFEQSYVETTITLLKDSIVLKSIHIKRDGKWSFNSIPAGEYLLSIDRPGCISLNLQVVVTAGNTTEVGTLAFKRKLEVLTPVVVRPKELRPRYKGDTVEYHVQGVNLAVNANVEELLKRLPGLQIDASGNITYNGEKVQRLLVDGEDIFASEPTKITRNFDAAKISQIQILDRRSDQALFTGIDDGVRIKTLNLVLRESAKHGHFGKIGAGANTDKYYLADGMLAKFRGKEQITALGLASNLGTLNYGDGIDFVLGSTDPLGASAGTGIPRLYATALHYANNLNESTAHIVTNYQFSNYLTRPITITQSIQQEPDSILAQSQSSQSINQQYQHAIYSAYDLRLSNRSSVRIVINENISRNKNEYNAINISTFNDSLVNHSQRSIRDQMSHNDLTLSGGWRYQIGKNAARTVSLSGSFGKMNNLTIGYIYSSNQFYQANQRITRVDTIDQRKAISDQESSVRGSINITEPLGKLSVLGLSYSASLNIGMPSQLTYNRGDGKYSETIDSLSTLLNTRQLDQRITFSLSGKINNLAYTAGIDWLHHKYVQTTAQIDTFSAPYYENLAPKMLLSYAFNRSTSLRFNYMGTPQYPSTPQLQPMVNNSDPLHIIIGNPKLTPEFAHNFWLEFRRSRLWLTNLVMNTTIAVNTISLKSETDSLGRQISQAINLGTNRIHGINLNASRNLLGIVFGTHANMNYLLSSNFVNTSLNHNSAFSGGGGVGIRKYSTDHFSLDLNTDFSYVAQTSTVSHSTPVRYWTQNHQGSFTVYFLHYYELNANATYTWQEKTRTFTSNASVLLFNAALTKNFLKDKLSVKWQINNLFNQNSGIIRTNSYNITTQTSTNILGRCWMLSATYHFDKTPKPN